eukprot:scaffold332876_cov24-Attheya_sp.AAC.1
MVVTVGAIPSSRVIPCSPAGSPGAASILVGLAGARNSSRRSRSSAFFPVVMRPFSLSCAFSSGTMSAARSV